MLIDQLNALADEVDSKIEFVNNGGCCVFAALVGRELGERGYPVQGAVGHALARTREGIHIARTRISERNVRNWNYWGIHFGHVVIELYDGTNVLQFDSDGIRDKSDTIWELPIYAGRLTVEEMEYLAADDSPYTWNDMFDRTQIPKMKSIINKHFKNIKDVDQAS